MHFRPASTRSSQNLRQASLSLLALFAASGASAATYTWDTVSGDGATITAGNGTWDLNVSNLVWNNAGANPSVAWAQGNSTTPLHAAVFAGTDTGSKSIVVGTDIAANSLTFNNSGYTLSSAAAQTIRLNGSLTVAPGKSATIGANTTITRTTTVALDVVGSGTLNVEGSGARILGNSNIINITGGGTVNIGAGGSIINSSQLVIGNASGQGTLNVNGGNVSIGTAGTANIVISNNATGTHSSAFTITSGNVTNSSTTGGLRFGSTTAGGTITATANLNGGITTVARVFEGNAGVTSNLNFDGGTLRVLSGSSNASVFLEGLNNVLVKEGGAILDTNNVATTVAQSLAHGGVAATDGGLTKRGAGTLTLTGNNTYTGTTTVDVGTLSLGRAGGTLLDTAAVNVNGGILDVAQADTVGAVTLTSGTISGAASLTGASYTLKSGSVTAQLSGSGVSLTKNTSGTATLAGSQSYTGATQIDAGILNVTGSLMSAITVGSSATLTGEGSTTGSLTLGAGSSFIFDPTTTGPGQHFISGGNITTTAGAGTKINIGLSTGVSSGTGIVVFEGASIISNGVSDFSLTSRGILSLTSTKLLFDYASGNVAWKGGNGTNPSFWDVNTTTQNFTLSGVNDVFFNADAVTFDDSASSFNVAIQGASVTPGAVVFDHSSNNYNVTGGAIAGATTTLTKAGTGTLILTNNNTYSGATTINGGVLQLGDGVSTSGSVAGPIVTNASLVVNQGAGNITLANAISGNGTLTQAGTGVLALTGNNSYGGTVISSGTLQIGAGSTSGSLGAGSVTNNGTLTFSRSDAITVTNSITGSGVIIKQGASSLTLGGSNSYSGNTSVTAGALIVSANNALGSASAGTSVSPGASLGITGGLTYSSTETIRGSGTGTTTANVGPLVAVQRGFVQSVSGNNTFAGNIQISATGVSRLGTQDGSSLTLTGNITMAAGVTGVFPLFRSGIDGDFVTLSGTGNNWDGNTQIFSGTNTGSSGVRLGVNNALPVGTSVVAGGNSTGAGTTLDLAGYNQTLNGLVASNGSLRISNSASTLSTLTLSNSADQSSFSITNKTIIEDGTGSGKVALVKTGSGNQTLVGSHTFTGGTEIQQGTLILGDASNTLANTSAVTVSGGTLAIGANNDTVGAVTLTSGSITGSTGVLTASSFNVRSGTISANLGGSGGLTKSTGGTVTLSGNNTYTGATSITGGTLELSGTGSINASSGITVNGGVFKNNSSVALTAPFIFTGGTLGGTNLSGISVTIGTGQKLSPGNSPGLLTTGDQTWNGGGSFDFEINDAIGVQDTNWDRTLIVGTLTLGTVSNVTPFTINLVSLNGLVAGDAANFDESLSQSWVFATATSISGTAFAADQFVVNTSGFSNAFTGSFGVSQSGNELLLTYTAIPEPSIFGALAGFGALGLACYRRRKTPARA